MIVTAKEAVLLGHFGILGFREGCKWGASVVVTNVVVFPQIRLAVAAPLAISRGIAVSGQIFDRLTRGGRASRRFAPRPPSARPLTNILCPFRALS